MITTIKKLVVTSMMLADDVCRVADHIERITGKTLRGANIRFSWISETVDYEQWLTEVSEIGGEELNNLIKDFSLKLVKLNNHVSKMLTY